MITNYGTFNNYNMYLYLFQAEENVKNYLDKIGEKFSMFTKTQNPNNEQNYIKKNKNCTEKIATSVDNVLPQQINHTGMNKIIYTIHFLNYYFLLHWIVCLFLMLYVW